MDNNKLINQSVFKFFLLVFALSMPFWMLGFITTDTTKLLPIKLPIAALMSICPLLAAVMLVYKKRKIEGVKELLKIAFDFKKINNKKWYVPIILLMPVIAVLSYLYIKMTGAILSESSISPSSLFVFFLVYFIGAIGEEVGWSGYIINPLQNKYGALKASTIIGITWAVWHIIPYDQAHQTTGWIVWQYIGTVCLRIIMV